MSQPKIQCAKAASSFQIEEQKRKNSSKQGSKGKKLEKNSRMTEQLIEANNESGSDNDLTPKGTSVANMSYNMVASSCDQSKNMSDSARSSLPSSRVESNSDVSDSESDESDEGSDYELADSYDEEVAN